MSESQPSDDKVIKTYVWHGSECFFVSTIERDSSAMLAPGRYNETLVWRFDWATQTRGKLCGQAEGPVNSITAHLTTCKLLYETGQSEPASE